MSPLLSDAVLRTQSDARLAALASQGHERAFGVLVERYRGSLVRVAARLVGADRAEDIAQQALLGAWRSLRGGTEVRHVRGWLFQSLRNTIRTEHARAHDQAPLADDAEDPATTETLAEGHLALAATMAALAELPDNQRVAIAQTELAGRSRREIARDLGISEGAVRQLLHRARATLRQAATALTPIQLALWAARPRAGSRLSEHVAELTGAGSAGAAASAAVGGGSGASLVGASASLKAGAALLAVAGAIGGGLAIEASTHHPHRPPGGAPPRSPSRSVALAAGRLQDRSTAGGAHARAHAGRPTAHPAWRHRAAIAVPSPGSGGQSRPSVAQPERSYGANPGSGHSPLEPNSSSRSAEKRHTGRDREESDRPSGGQSGESRDATEGTSVTTSSQTSSPDEASESSDSQTTVTTSSADG
jgi:RNA polymerase sigma factor (sigma-70 family)